MIETYRPLIERALAHTDGAWTWGQLREELESGRAWLIKSPTGESVAVLQPVKDLHVFTASGDLRELLVMEAQVSDKARRNGFDRMTMIGRDGWGRVLRPRGWQREVSLVKDL